MLKNVLRAAVSAGAAAVLGAGAHAASATERLGDWEVEEMVDKMDDTTRGVAVARSVGSPETALVIKCDAAGDGVYVHLVGPYQGATARDRTRPFVYRVDKQAKTEEQWRYMKDGAVQFDNEKARRFARLIVNGKVLMVRQYSSDFTTTDFEFRIGGAKQALDRVFSICMDTF
ncbi:hypothetical protein ACOTHZ_11260 [Achromobacter xylosoxidans]